VDAFDGRAKNQRLASPAPARLGGGHAKNWPEPFTAGKHRVAHRLVERLRLGRRLGEMLVQGVIDLLDAAVDVTLKRKEFGLGLLVWGNRHTEVLSNPP